MASCLVKEGATFVSFSWRQLWSVLFDRPNARLSSGTSCSPLRRFGNDGNSSCCVDRMGGMTTRGTVVVGRLHDVATIHLATCRELEWHARNRVNGKDRFVTFRSSLGMSAGSKDYFRWGDLECILHTNHVGHMRISREPDGGLTLLRL